MDFFSKTELEFTTKAIQNKVRLDTRGFMEEREQILVEQDVPQADRSIKIRRGLSEIDLNISFKSSSETLSHLGLMNNDNDGSFMDRFFRRSSAIEALVLNQHLSSENLQTLQTKLDHPNPVFTRLESFLRRFKIGALIEISVVRDDGNVFDMVFDGIRYIFSDIAIPDVSNLSEERKEGIDLPWSASFAVFQDAFVADPLLIEESSSCGIVHIFKEADQSISVFTERPVGFELLKKVLASEMVQYVSPHSDEFGRSRL